MFVENIQIHFDYTKRIHDPGTCNRLNRILILPRDSWRYLISATEADTIQPNVSPDIACWNIRFSSLFTAGDISRGDVPRGRRARRNGCFRRLPLTIFLATDKPSPVPKQFSIQTWPHPPLFPLCILLVGEALLKKIQRRFLTLINIVNALTPLLWSTFCKIERQTLKQFCAGDGSLNFSCLLVPPPPPSLLTFLRSSSVPGSVPERRISADPWIKFCSVFVF